MALTDRPVISLSPEDIMDVLRAFIREERVRSFSFLGRHSHEYMRQADLLEVSRADSGDIKEVRYRDKRRQHLATFSDEQFHVFSEPMCTFDSSRTVALTPDPGFPPTADNITITALSPSGVIRTSLASDWLRETFDNHDEACMKSSEAQYEEQSLWWESTGKVFNFLTLPAELRNQIYLQTIGPVILPDLEGSRMVLGRGLSLGKDYMASRYRDPDVERPNLAILRISKQVNAEALEVAYCDTIDVQPVPGTPLKIKNGRFRLVTLQNFRALRNLDFRFISPKHPDAMCPWALNSGSNTSGAHSCQKQWIEWFLAMAWQRLRSLQQPGKPIHFTLSGCVKTSTKSSWEHLLNDRQVDHAAEIKEMVEEIAEKAIDAPIPCKCTVPCSTADSAKLKQYTWDESDIRHIEGLQEHINDGYWCFKD
ncbi:hypothetical protein EK21DRAFT_75623 [Setomelanomma holmii]|uniref:Uncharacterized protein n=1 Tax=Setomelanomma holmii TaxID=210430 RepID=A0A9P4LHS5_9PLEO|nr:hypothetical protein EK21DRAFT_75623 [Setomelanomma holmii]